MDGCHQQCRRDSLATDVANSQNQSVRIHGEEIVISPLTVRAGRQNPCTSSDGNCEMCCGKSIACTSCAMASSFSSLCFAFCSSIRFSIEAVIELNELASVAS